jgi:hypothetical protein
VAVSTDNPYTFGITGPTTLYAVFTKYTVTISAADTYYDNFATALTAAIAASGSTLTLHADAPATAAQAALTSTTLTIQTTTAGGPWKIPLSGTGSLFTLGSGATLNLAEKIVLEGIGGNNAALVTVNSGGSLSMSGSASVTGNTGGGGVYINGGEFTMSGSASITGNTGSGVCIVNSGQFTMNAGTISGNTGANVGGGVCINNGIFAMNGGTIGGGNSATFGGGVNIDNNGTFNLNSPATLSDITGNTATIGGKGHKVYKTSAASFNIDSIPVTSGWTNTHGSNPYWD